MEIKNKKAIFDYIIEKKYTSGIVLTGYEIKSIRLGKVSIKESFCKIIKNEIFLFNCNISKYENANTFYEIDEKRPRKLLLKKKEINYLNKIITQDGYTVVPLKIFINDNNLCKLELGIAKGKKKYDKRESIKEREQKIKSNASLKNIEY